MKIVSFFILGKNLSKQDACGPQSTGMGLCASWILWLVIWTLVLNISPGHKTVKATYRLNFWNGIASSLAAILNMLGHLTVENTTPILMSYFVVDIINNVLNDFYFKAGGYHTPFNRAVEYFHHFLCLSLGVANATVGDQVCLPQEEDRFVQLMIAELGTPFLMHWREFGGLTNGLIFSVLFFIVRFYYHGLYVLPHWYHSCHFGVWSFFAFSYMAMNIVFFKGILGKLWRIIGRLRRGESIDYEGAPVESSKQSKKIS